MYWQVYYHKTVFAAENMLIKILKRAKFLAQNQENLFATPSLDYFLKNNFTENDFNENEKVLDTFALLDDFDIYTSIKVWSNHNDKILSFLCKSLVNRHLYKTEIQNQPFEETYIDEIKKRVKNQKMLKSQQKLNLILTE
jgi:HD superfamily phosphohydrolase